MDLYKEELLEHYKNPNNYGIIENPDVTTGEYNPSCGDSVELTILLTNNVISQVKFTGKGCVISQATASMLTNACVNKTIEQVLKLDQDFVQKMIGIELGPNRLKCAMLSLDAVHKGLMSWQLKL